MSGRESRADLEQSLVISPSELVKDHSTRPIGERLVDVGHTVTLTGKLLLAYRMFATPRPILIWIDRSRPCFLSLPPITLA